MALNNPLLDNTSIKGASAILLNIKGGPDISLFEIDEAASLIRSQVDENAKIIFDSGKIIFINPSGVIFHGGSKVDVGAMIATSLNMSDSHFLNEDYFFEKDGNYDAVIKNNGEHLFAVFTADCENEVSGNIISEM